MSILEVIIFFLVVWWPVFFIILPIGFQQLPQKEIKFARSAPNKPNILIKFMENKDSFKENEWKELYKISENTFVEENESLKNVGAGAGLTDND